MRATYRRLRRPDPFADPAAVRALLENLRAVLPDLIPRRETDLIKLLRAVRHIYHYPAGETRRGRPARWSRPVLLTVGGQLSALLDCETQGRIGLKSFVDHYLRVPDFPFDVQ